jgi:dTDP-4-amino-4,6-dideoxygalactose transaminase
MIRIAQPEISKEEIDAVNEVLQSGILAQGARVAQLEENFASYCGTKYAVAVNSGTAAIHAALHVAGVKEGDEVITVPFSFIATINPILMVGATPVLVDIDPATFCIDVSKIEDAITPKTKAIIAVHLYGQTVDQDKLAAIAKKHGLKVIEDACQAVASEYKGKKAGNLGDLGCFSLYATKNIMCGEGGMITTNDEAYMMKLKQFRQHGMSAPYMYEELGFNYRLTDLQAAIAVEQLKKVDRFTAARQSNAQKLTVGLKNINGIETPVIAPDRTHVFHQYTIRVTPELGMSRDDFVKALQEKEVGAGVYYPRALHTYPHVAKFGYSVGDFPEAEKAAAEVVSLPVHPHVSPADIDTIIKTIKEIAHV